MRNRIVWASLGFLLVLTMVLASCKSTTTSTAPTVVTSTATTTVVAPTTTATTTTSAPTPTAGPETVTLNLTKLDGSKVTKTVEKPQYEGVYVQCWSFSPVAFNDALNTSSYDGNTTMYLTHQVMIEGDWYRSAQGTGEASFTLNLRPPALLRAGMIAESWDIPAPTTIIWHIRHGVHFALNTASAASKLVNGRELDANDVAWAFNHLAFERKTSFQSFYSAASRWGDDGYIKATDKWTVEMKFKADFTQSHFAAFGFATRVYPKEVVDKYGEFSDWQSSVGPGPFILTDYVSGSSATFVRNPTYWQHDPLFPENQLPYAAGVKYLIVPDPSTQLAALRTGKIDQIMNISLDTAKSMWQSNPELKYLGYTNGKPPVLCFRIDKADLPFKNKAVRQALSMGVNRDALVQDLYGSNADSFTYPVANIPEYSSMYIPLDQYPQATQDIYTYHPDKAIQLLKDAGYASGFTTSIVCKQSDVDLLTLVKADWAKIGVTLNLDVKEDSVWTTMGNNKTYTDGYAITWDPSAVIIWSWLQPGNVVNYAMVNDPTINDTKVKVDNSWWPDENAQFAAVKAFAPYLADFTPWISLPTPKLFTFWQPWVKGYSGEYANGWISGRFSYMKYLWVDQKLKASMGK